MTVIVLLLGNGVFTTLLALFLGEALRRNTTEQVALLEDRLKHTQLEHEARFAYLHQRRAECVIELYKRLRRLYRQANRDATPIPVQFLDIKDPDNPLQYFPDLQEAWNQVVTYFQENEILLSESERALFDRTLGKMTQARGALVVATRQEITGKDDMKDARDIVWKVLNDEMPPLMETLRETIHGLLGIGDNVSAR